jgi:hypothetical protein
MCNANVDEPRLLTARHDFDGEAKRRFGAFKECRGVLRDTQRIGADRPHTSQVETAQAFAKALQAFERTLLRFFIEALLAIQSGAKTDRFPQRIQWIDLITDDTRNLQVERV